ncbi:50S ribosomal protein L29 [Acaryochloris thomasi RCC1774]|uniref:Large ribosomal subunit protein uL29 n=1 Tax=Acaryochloris thomasi RCC1774 TaxID=1764569 RepID=A0A2W1JQC1_9CYAN|nr:50S ribosomal protein L29 [Acaryochloris thomasi]PZD75523.1 50S ribosomal protein L29 [Acaryochloris thomasi RCC1774]
MASSKMSDLRKLSEAEVETKIQDLKRELFDLRFQKATRQTVQPHQAGQIRHQIAQLMTLQREQQA